MSKFLRNANGWGSVSKLSGKRRNPYMVRGETYYEVDMTSGKLKEKRQIIGYASTREEGLKMLANYTNNNVLRNEIISN